MRYRLRTLMIVLAILPPLLGYLWPRPPKPVPIAIVRQGETAEVDLIQVNTTPNFTQVLFWSRYPNGELHVRTWRLNGSKQTKNMKFKHSGGTDCECTWTESGIERRVLAPMFQETKSPNDPEIDDRLKLPKPDRIPLWKDSRSIERPSRGCSPLSGCCIWFRLC